MIIAIIGSILFALIMILYITLVFGAPLGEFAMGGMHKVMLTKSRIAVGFSVLVQALAILVLLQLGSVFSIGIKEGLAKGLGYFFSFYLVINVLMNLISKSKKERFVMTPLSIIIAACYLFTTFSS